MLNVLNCLIYSHDIKLVMMAAFLCFVGTAMSMKLHSRTLNAVGSEAIGWTFLTAVSAGTSIWATHFIAMLGFHSPAPVTVEPVLTIVSLLVAIAGTGVGILVGISRFGRLAPLFGGAIIGVAIAGMHYIGMFAYRVEGIIVWDQTFINVSLVAAIGFSAAAFHVAHKNRNEHDEAWAAVILFLGIVILHFTGMTAFTVVPLSSSVPGMDSGAFEAMALSVAIACLLIAGAGMSSYLIDSRVRSQSDEQIRYLALYDQLTGLLNRTSYNQRLDEALAAAANSKCEVAVVAIDLDRFKEINDNRGHAAGDEALRIVSRRLQAIFTGNAHIARIGGDEFAAVIPCPDRELLQSFLEEVATAISLPLFIEGAHFRVFSSIGVAIFPENGSTRETLLNNADMAMYSAKSDRQEKICYYNQELDNKIRATRVLVDDLRQAIGTDQLYLCYQVQTSMETNEILSYEALMRWRHPEQGMISPAVFIPLAEENGLILQLGEWALRQACGDASRWQPAYKVAVNVSGVQLNQQDLPTLVRQVLEETGLPPSQLELELTETAVVNDKVRSLEVIRQIKELGVKIALDDFGVGYSSLETLRVFPFDKIKLDRFFVESIEREPQCLAIVRAVLTLGKSLEIPILAEGIETREQLRILASEGCDEGQGFKIGKPLPNAELAGIGGPRSVDLAEATDQSIERLRQILQIAQLRPESDSQNAGVPGLSYLPIAEAS
jgi:diguanylate cyclase (GGDEF)-like protein